MFDTVATLAKQVARCDTECIHGVNVKADVQTLRFGMVVNAHTAHVCECTHTQCANTNSQRDIVVFVSLGSMCVS